MTTHEVTSGSNGSQTSPMPEAACAPRAIPDAATAMSLWQREHERSMRTMQVLMAEPIWLTRSEIAELAGVSELAVRQQAQQWQANRLIFSLGVFDQDYFPYYALDPQDGYRPYPAMRAVLEVFAGHKSETKVALWFISLCSFLGGRRPMDVLAIDAETVIAAAKDEVAGVQHGRGHPPARLASRLRM